MKAASVNDIKKELKEKKPAELVELCLRLARFKKDNKELLTFLLFDADDLEQYISGVRQQTEDGFAEINTSHVYYAKKSLRKILRIINKHIRYTGSKQAEVELLMHFCSMLKNSGIKFQKHAALKNLYDSQVKKIKAAIATMHEDLQHDDLRQLGTLEY
jgi:hypothetical protein